MTRWSRPVGAPMPFCAVSHVAGGSVETYCLGRWDASLPTEDDEEPPRARKCRRCRAVLDEIERLMAAGGDLAKLFGAEAEVPVEDEIAATFGEILAEDADEQYELARERTALAAHVQARVGTLSLEELRELNAALDTARRSAP